MQKYDILFSTEIYDQNSQNYKKNPIIEALLVILSSFCHFVLWCFQGV